MRQGVYVTKITGNVFVISNGETRLISKDIKLGVNKKYEVITEDASYTYVTTNPHPESKRPGFFACLFPKTKVIVYTGRGYIKTFEILHGLVFGQTLNVITPTAEFKGEERGGCWIDVDSDGKTMVADTRDTVYNRKTKKAVVLSVNQQLLVTEDDIGEPEPMGQVFYQAKKTLENLHSFGGAEMYQQVAEKSDALLNAYLTSMKFMCQKTGEDFNKLKEEAESVFQKQKQWLQTESEQLYQRQKKVKSSDIDRDVSIIPINQVVKYQGIEWKIISVKREPKSDETDVLTINIEGKNESEKEVFVFWNEESRFITEKGDTFCVDDYTLETAYMPGTQSEGYLFIPVRKDEKKFKLQFGKRSLPKVELEIDLSQNEGGS